MCMACCVPGPCPIFLNLNIHFAAWLQFFKNLNRDLPTSLSPHTSDIFLQFLWGSSALPLLQKVSGASLENPAGLVPMTNYDVQNEVLG